MSSTNQNVSASHESGATPTVAPSTGNTNTASTNPPGGDTTYPEQIHAGKVGYGPNYRSGPSLEDKIQGLKEELKGKVTKNPDLVEHGRQVKSGEEKRKKLTGEDEPNPFTTAKEDDSEDKNKVKGTSAPSPPHDQYQTQDSTHDGEHHQPSTHTPSSQSHSQVPSSQNQPTTSDTQHPQLSTHAPVVTGPNGPIGMRDGELQGATGTQNPHAHFEPSRIAQQNETSSQTDPFGMAPSQTSGQQYNTKTNTDTDFSQHQSQPLNRTPAPTPSSRFDSDNSLPQQQSPKANPFGMAVNQGHGKGAMEQAATVAPEGTEDAEKQRRGNNVDFATRPEARQ